MRYELLVDGDLCAGRGLIDVVDPATGKVFAQCARASAEQADQAVEAAAGAFGAWSRMPLSARQSVLALAAEIVAGHADELARLLTMEQGKPLAESKEELAGAVYQFRHYSRVDIPVKVIEDNEMRRVEVHRRPLGVVAAILPWNAPVLLAAARIATALVVGNTIVVKPAPTTPLTTLRLGALLKDIFPRGTVNIITDRNDLGALLTAHPRVRKVSFTGSTTTGLKVMGSAAQTLKRVTLELGGNDAGIVLEDCDPIEIAPKLFRAAFYNNGQICVALKRLFVHERIYDAVCRELAAIAQRAVVGPGLDEGTQLGPLQNRAQYEKVRALVDAARRDGVIIAGGDCPDRPGYFVNPTIVRDITEGSRLVDEEQFGPVLPVLKFSDLAEVVRRANATSYGLGNSVWSSDPARASEVAAMLESGSVWINQHARVVPTTPFAGAKMSGVGVEHGDEGLAELTQIKVISIAKGEKAPSTG